GGNDRYAGPLLRRNRARLRGAQRERARCDRGTDRALQEEPGAIQGAVASLSGGYVATHDSRQDRQAGVARTAYVGDADVKHQEGRTWPTRLKFPTAPIGARHSRVGRAPLPICIRWNLPPTRRAKNSSAAAFRRTRSNTACWVSACRRHIRFMGCPGSRAARGSATLQALP